jgi:hypothetical protein
MTESMQTGDGDALPSLSPEEQQKAMGVDRPEAEGAADEDEARDLPSLTPEEQMKAMGIAGEGDPQAPTVAQ